MTINGGQEVQDTFMRTFGVDFRKHWGGGISNLSHIMDVEKIKWDSNDSQNHHRQSTLPLHEW